MISVKNLSKKFNEEYIFRNISYDFLEGRKYIIKGPSGSGKTTFLRLTAGFESIDEGEIFINGELIGNRKFQVPPSQRCIGIVTQDPSLWSHMTVEKNISFGLEHLSKKERKLVAKNIMDDMEISHISRHYPSEISGGEAKRAALARMLVRQWKYLLLDEPLANIDKELKNRILERINIYTERNNTALIYVTHDEGDGERINGEVLKFKDL